MNSFLIYWICCFFCICSCIIFVPNRACLYCLSYLFVFSKENIQFCGWKCTFLFHPCIHQSNCRSSRSYFFIPEHTFDILSKIPFRSWKYLWSFSNNFAMTFQWKFCLGFALIQQNQWHKHCFTPRMRKHKPQKSEFYY